MDTKLRLLWQKHVEKQQGLGQREEGITEGTDSSKLEKKIEEKSGESVTKVEGVETKMGEAINKVEKPITKANASKKPSKVMDPKLRQALEKRKRDAERKEADEKRNARRVDLVTNVVALGKVQNVEKGDVEDGEIGEI
jgi:hypothetical protein